MNAISAFIGIASAFGIVATAIWPPLADVDRLIFPTAFAVLLFVSAAMANARAS